MKSFEEYFHKKVEISCKSGRVFRGIIISFGGSVQGKEEYGVDEEFISIYPGDSCYVLFRSEIENIKEI